MLDIPNMELSFSVERETMERIDLWIQSDKDIIVIENKIKSGINGVKEDYSQLRKYREFAEANKDKKNSALLCFCSKLYRH